MTFKEGYFELLVGSVTMDVFQPVQGEAKATLFIVSLFVYIKRWCCLCVGLHSWIRQTKSAFGFKISKTAGLKRCACYFPKKYMVGNFSNCFHACSNYDVDRILVHGH